jgi:endonuclease/exonuclease/phosphatase family metal-dependent hydrolase
MRKLTLLFCLLAAALGAETLRVMSFNVRFPSLDDGDNRWEFRRDLLVATIREKDPDLLGTQELFYEQGEYIAGKLSGYAWFGVSRRGNREDEHMGVFYKKDKLRVVDSGNFWLSETPETPGSMSWDVSLPRMGRLPKDVPFVMTGDFNSPAGGDVFKLFTAQLKDSWDTAVKRSGPEGTNSGFAGRTTGRRIDWILYRGPLRAVEAETITRNEKGRYPSDHFPIFAALEF